jgi:hypothetical protein
MAAPFGGLDELAECAFDLGMAAMTDEHDAHAVFAVARDFQMDLGDERAGGVEHPQTACLGGLTHALGHAVGAEDQGRVVRYVVEFLDEDGAAFTQSIDDEAVVDDFVADIDGCAIAFEYALDDGDGAVDAGAETAWVGEFGEGVLHSLAQE